MVVNWNDAERSVRCLESVRKSWPEAILVLVDNGSQEDPGPALGAGPLGVTLLKLGSNFGYAAGCNAGTGAAIAAGASHVLLLNNDATLEEGSIPALLAAAGRHPGSIIAPLIVYADRPDRVWSAGGYVNRPFFDNHHHGKGEPVSAHFEERRVDWATGCALFFEAACFRRVGPLDEAYFLYLEDTDWCLRAARVKVETWLAPAAVVRHEVSASVEALPSWQLRYYAHRNHYRLALRHATGWAKPLVLGDALWTLFKAGLRSAISAGHRRDGYYHARTRGVADFLRGRVGPATVSSVPAAAAVVANR